MSNKLKWKMLVAVAILLLHSYLAAGLPKTSTNTEGGVVINEIPLAVPSRPRSEQPYLRHGLSSDSRRSEGRDFCRKPAKCQPILNSTCLTTKVPYTQTSIELVGDVQSQEDIQVSFCVFPRVTLELLKTLLVPGKIVAVAKSKKCS